MRGNIIPILVAMSMLATIPLASLPSTAATTFEVTTFSNGLPSVTVGFPGAGMVDSASLSLQTGLTIDTAALKVSSLPPPSGNAYPTNVSVDIGGDGVAEWQFKGQNIGQLGRQTLFTTGASKAEMWFKTMQYNDTLAFRLPKRATVTSASMNVTMAAKGRILVIYGDKDLNAVNNVIDNIKKFSSEIAQVDSFDGSTGTPTLDLLQKYSSCLVYCMGYSGMSGYTLWSSNGALGDVLADYVDWGGGVVTAGLCWATSYGNIAGRFASGGYYAMPMGTLYGGSNVAIASILKPDHPIMKNVASISYAGSTCLLYFASTTAVNGGDVVFTWNAGPSIGACVLTRPNGVNRVDIMNNPWSMPISRASYGVGYTGDMDILTKNSLIWTGKAIASGDTLAPGVVIDIMKDGINEFNYPLYAGNFSINNIAPKLNSYLATAPVAFTDAYGNEFVDIPINVTPYNMTTAIFGGMEILYKYNANVDKNPVTGDLSSALAGLTSPKPGNYNSTIPIIVSSESAGLLKLSDLKLTLRSPYHKPSITSFFPAAVTVVKEGTILDMGINATDWYGALLSYKWFYNGNEVPNLTEDRMTVAYGFKDAGSYTARVEVFNTFVTVSQDWKITVQNVNRAPEIVGFSPDGDREMSEGTTLAFNISITDPDDDPIGYMWRLDGVLQGSSTVSSFTYRPDYNSAGDHVIKVTAVDQGSLSVAQDWNVRVKDQDRPPLLTAWDPIDDPTLLETQQQQFAVSASDVDGQELSVLWKLDGTTVSEDSSYTYKTDYSSAGLRTLVATVTDGELSASHEWTITVLDLNRPPTAAIDSPPINTEFMQGAAIHISGNSSSDPDGEKLSYSWKEGGVLVSDQAVFDRAFSHGLHTLTLEVRDHEGAASQATVHFRVRWVEMSLVMGLDKLDAAAGDKVTITVTLSNTGDTKVSEQKLDIMVDGKKIATEDLPMMAAGGSYKTQFQWKAVKGPHTITAVIGDQSWNQPASVGAEKTAAAGSALNDMLWLGLIVVLAVVLLVWGRYALGKK